MYESVHKIIATKIPTPDLVVYLRADTGVLMNRIAQRDRTYERAMDRDYIAQLGDAYDDFFSHYAQSPVLTIDTNDLDFVQRAEDLQLVINRIRANLGIGVHQHSLFEHGGGA